MAEAAKFGLEPVLHPDGSLRTLRGALKAALSGLESAPAEAA
jgi:hypothetical protein